MIDGHMHLEYGPLDVEYLMKFVKVAQEKGIDTIQILDHTHRFLEFAPMYEHVKDSAQQQKVWFEKKTLEPLSDYFTLIETVKAMELPIEVRFGLEVCYAPKDKEFLKDLLAQYPYDFLIGSIHSIDGLLYDMAGFSKEILWDKFDTNAIYKRYYEIMEDMIASDLFTQIGHPDQLKLFNHYPTYDLIPTYERIAKLAKEHDVYMETNTGAHYRYRHKDIGTNDEFMQVMKRYGVKIMTASDAHKPDHVGSYIKEVTEMTKDFLK